MMKTKESVCRHVLRLHHLPSVSVHNIQPYLSEVVHPLAGTGHDKHKDQWHHIVEAEEAVASSLIFPI